MKSRTCWATGVVAIVALASCIAPPFPEYIFLQHFPTVAVLALVMFTSKRFPISHSSLALLFGFLLLHILGARYSYSYVPYDDWSSDLLGKSISQLAGWSRNHYDRLVHLCYGLLLAPVAQEILERYARLPRRASIFFAVEFIMATSMIYEVAEWLITLLFASETADAYNGQQGDMWDAQKDMALATAGALLSAGWMLLRNSPTKRLSQG